MDVYGAGNSYAGQANVAQVAPSQPDTLPSLLDDIVKLSCQIRDFAGHAADNLNGSVPAASPDCAKNPNEPTILDRTRTIRYVLQDALDNQQRVMRALAL